MTPGERPGEPVKRASADSYPILLLLPVCLLAVLQIIGYAFPSIHTWSFSGWSALGLVPLLTTILLLVLMAVPSIAAAVTSALTSLAEAATNSGRSVKVISIIVISILLFSLFVAFRSRAPIFGDGFGIVWNSTLPLFSHLDSTHELFKPLTVMLYRIGGTIFSKDLNWDDQLSCGLVSCVGGVVAFWGLWRLSRSLRSKSDEAIALMAAGLASGCTVLLFGHLELYVWPTALTLWLLSYAIDYLNGAASRARVVLWATLTLTSEFMLIPLILVIFFLLAGKKAPQENHRFFAFGLSAPAMSWLILACSVICGVLFTVIPHAGAFVPVWPVGDRTYTLFQPSHILDLFNLIILIAPLILFSLIPTVSLRKRSNLFEEQGEKLLAVGALSLFLVSVWLDPELGALRDWDLLSFFGFPASILAGLLLLNRFPGRKAASLVTSLSLGLIALTIVPQVGARQDVDKAAARMDAMLWEDPHYQTSYDGALRGVPWASLLQTNTNRFDLASKYFWRRISVDPKSDISWYNLGEMALNHQQYDSALTMLEKAYQLLPENDIYVVRYAEALQHLNQSDKVAPLLPRIAAIEGDNLKLLEYSGVVLATAGEYEKALRLFRMAYKVRPWDYGTLQNLAFDFMSLQQSDSAIYYLDRTVRLAPSADRPNLFRGLLREQLKSGRIDDARTTLAEYRRQFPDGAGIKEVQQYLDKQK